MKQTCVSCNKKTNNLNHHKCTIITNGIIQAAWEGDAQHKLDLIRISRLNGVENSFSTKLSNLYFSNEAQAKYLQEGSCLSKEKKNELKSLSVHKQGTYFEFLYHSDKVFKSSYQFYFIFQEKFEIYPE